MQTYDHRKSPISPDTSAFQDHVILMDLFNCWVEARGDAMLPKKKVFEKTALDHPQILPDLALVEFTSPTEFHYRYLGSERVQRRGQDQTNESVEGAFAPKARQFLSDWTRAGFEKPHITVWIDRTRLPDGTVAESTNLSVVLTGDTGLPNCIAVVTDVDKAYNDQLAGSRLLIGSAGMEAIPIDIGLGVPDLPRSLA